MVPLHSSKQKSECGAVLLDTEELKQSFPEVQQAPVDNLRIASENLAQLTDHVNHQPWSLVRIRQPKDRKVPK